MSPECKQELSNDLPLDILHHVQQRLKAIHKHQVKQRTTSNVLSASTSIQLQASKTGSENGVLRANETQVSGRPRFINSDGAH